MKNTSAIRAFSFTFEAELSLAVGEEEVGHCVSQYL